MLYSVTKDRILSVEFSMPMLRELCERYLGMTADAVTQLANQKLNKGSDTVRKLPYGKLRTVALTKMGNGFAQQYPAWEANGAVDLDFACLDPQEPPKQEQAHDDQREQAMDQDGGEDYAQEQAERAKQAQQAQQEQQGPNFGANTRRRGAGPKGPQHKGATPRKGAYKVAKRTAQGTATNGSDPGMWEIWQHIWGCTSFEEYFAKAPAKATKRTGTVITASSEMAYALRSGFIVVETEA